MKNLSCRFVAALISLSPLCVTQAGPAGTGAQSQLQWGTLFNQPEPPAEVSRALARLLQEARLSLDEDMSSDPIPAFHLQGTLNKDPVHQASDRAKAHFPDIFALAVCARVAEHSLGVRCAEKARAVLLAWAGTYHSTGNPVDDSFFVPLLQAVDLLLPLTGAADQRTLQAWVREFTNQEDLAYGRKKPDDTVRFNNWMATRLLLRSMAATISQDRVLQDSTRRLLDEFTQKNFIRTPGTGADDGETYDFVQRDSLDYHVGDLLPLVQIELYTPSLADAGLRNHIARGLGFLQPFYTGEVHHTEFVHSTIQFDAERVQHDKNNPAFQYKDWNPAGARNLLALARGPHADIRPWTADIAVAKLDARTQLLAAIYQ